MCQEVCANNACKIHKEFNTKKERMKRYYWNKKSKTFVIQRVDDPIRWDCHKELIYCGIYKEELIHPEVPFVAMLHNEMSNIPQLKGFIEYGYNKWLTGRSNRYSLTVEHHIDNLMTDARKDKIFKRLREVTRRKITELHKHELEDYMVRWYKNDGNSIVKWLSFSMPLTYWDCNNIKIGRFIPFYPQDSSEFGITPEGNYQLNHVIDKTKPF
jgi:hypothetical protein